MQNRYIVVLRRLFQTQTENLSLFTNHIDYRRHVIEVVKVKVPKHGADAIHKLQAPAIVAELRANFGVCNVLRRFVPKLARIASPLSK